MKATIAADRDLVEIFGAVQSLLLSTENVEDMLRELVVLAAGIVEPPAAVGITVTRDGQPFTVATSDRRANELDETQYDIGQGPCLTSLETGEIVEVVDQRLDDRWPEYARRANEQGVRCSISLPLTVDNAPVGALNIYGYAKPNSFSDDELRAAAGFAAQASVALTLLTRHVKQAEVSEQLEQALTSRSTIDQAIGVLMGQQRCTAEDAFALLRANSQNTNRKLRDVAADLIERLTGQPPSAPHGFVRSSQVGSAAGIPPQKPTLSPQ